MNFISEKEAGKLKKFMARGGLRFHKSTKARRRGLERQIQMETRMHKTPLAV